MDGLHLIDLALEPKWPADRERFLVALARLAAEDPRLGVKTDQESGQTVISGASEDDLDKIVTRLREEDELQLNTGAPQVAYREAITRAVSHDYTHSKRSGGSGQFARIKFRIEPGSGNSFVSAIAGGHLPAEYVAAVRTGVDSVMAAGPVIGFLIVDVRFILTDGAYHDVDSSVLAFEIAGRMGFIEAIEKAAPKVLEPIMQIEVRTPEGYVGDVIGDLNSRRGQVRAIEERGVDQLLGAIVPLANMFGYATSLRAMTRNAGRFQLAFSHYEQTPPNVDDPDGRFPPAAAMRA